jgi:hypothetical protein
MIVKRNHIASPKYSAKNIQSAINAIGHLSTSCSLLDRKDYIPVGIHRIFLTLLLTLLSIGYIVSRH